MIECVRFRLPEVFLCYTVAMTRTSGVALGIAVIAAMGMAFVSDLELEAVIRSVASIPVLWQLGVVFAYGVLGVGDH